MYLFIYLCIYPFYFINAKYFQVTQVIYLEKNMHAKVMLNSDLTSDLVG